MNNQYFVIDFDSTFVQVESIELLAKLSLENNPDKQQILQQIHDTTNQAMSGKQDLFESLIQRCNLLQINAIHIQQAVEILHTKITNSFHQYRDFFVEYADNIYVVSSGFKELILPIVTKYGVLEKNIYANNFYFNQKLDVVGFDQTNPLCKIDGKSEVVSKLNLPGTINVIGDGFNDYAIKQSGIADNFFLFTENVQRDNLLQLADKTVDSLGQVLCYCGIDLQIKGNLKALLLENVNPVARRILEANGFQVEQIDKALAPNELQEKIKDYSVLGIRSKTQISQTLIEKAEKLDVIGCFCIGTNQVDLQCCASNGIAVFNAPYSNTRSVVELAICEIILLLRNVIDKNSGLHKGIWSKTSKGAHEIRGKKLGIIGYGNIGTQLSVVAENLGIQVLFYDIVDKLPMGNAIKCSSMFELLSQVDVISIHVDGREENINLIGEKQISYMLPGVVLLNLSRGNVVDYNALSTAVKQGIVKGVAVDVFPDEPSSSEQNLISPLQNLPNTVLTPHIGGSTIEAQYDIGSFVANKIVTYLKQGGSIGAVNLPQLEVPILSSNVRLLHIHHNQPGILAKINHIFAKYEINIDAQYLSTSDKFGYVITDISHAVNELLSELQRISGTIKISFVT